MTVKVSLMASVFNSSANACLQCEYHSVSMIMVGSIRLKGVLVVMVRVRLFRFMNSRLASSLHKMIVLEWLWCKLLLKKFITII